MKPYPVLTPIQFIKLRHQIRLAEKVIVEPKYDGYLVIAHRDGFVNAAGMKASMHLVKALQRVGVYREISEIVKDGYKLFIEVYGSGLTPHGYHKNHHRIVDYIVLDVYDEIGGVMLPPEKAKPMLKTYGIRYVQYSVCSSVVMRRLEAYAEKLLEDYRGWEGVVIKAYKLHGHKMPGFLARLGVMMVKVKHVNLPLLSKLAH